MRSGSIFTTATRLAESELEKEYTPPEESNLSLANGMLLHNDHSSKRSNLSSPMVLKYPRGG